jgi:hypothetical protein
LVHKLHSMKTSMMKPQGANGIHWANRIIGKRTTCPYCQNKLFHMNEFGTIFFATCYNKCL